MAADVRGDAQMGTITPRISALLRGFIFRILQPASRDSTQSPRRLTERLLCCVQLLHHLFCVGDEPFRPRVNGMSKDLLIQRVFRRLVID